MGNLFNKCLTTYQAFDRVEIVAVPRYKTSELSGDEWRTSAFIRFWFKGEMVMEKRYGNMRVAAAFLAGLVYDTYFGDDDAYEKVSKLRDAKCDQHSCDRDWTVKYLIKQEYSSVGETLAREGSSDHYRKFCPIHSTRGDCSLEDSDDNYELMEERGEGRGSVPGDDVSPSGFGGIIQMD